MARRKKTKEPLDRPEREYAWAIDSLVARDRLDRDLVLLVFNRAADLRGEHGDGIITAVLSSLRFAVSCVGAERAAAIFQDPALSSLVWRAGLPGHLANLYVPLLTREELATLFGDFRAYLVSNRPALLGSGLPDTPFTASLWLDSLAGRLYYTKVSEPAGEVPGRRACKWESSAPEPTHEDSPRQPGALLPGLSAEDAETLEGIRPKMLDLELKVFSELEDALRRQDPHSVWTRCLSLMVDALSHEEAALCVRLDSLYAEPERRIRESSMELSPPLLQPRGALSGLLDLIGHCEVELLVGIMDEAKTSLLETARRFGRSSWREVLGKSYFDTMDEPWKNDLDSILDRFFEDQVVIGEDLWGGFRARVNEALESEFYQNFITKIRVKRRLAATFEPQFLPLANSLYAYFEATGSLPQLALTFSGQAPSQEECVFRLAGEYWIIRYAGKEVLLKSALGFMYMAELLRHPNRGFPGTELAAAAARGRVHTGPEEAPALEESEALEEGLSVGGLDAGEPVIDRRAVQGNERALVMLARRREQASARGDRDAEGRIKAEMKRIQSYLKGSRGLHGRIRRTRGSAERAHRAVSARIADAIRKVEKKNSELGSHFRRAIRTRGDFIYSPEKPVPWSL
jgi:hypothetical protein